MEEDVVSSISDNFSLLLDLIPEINDIVGFDHKNSQYHLDVWEHTLLALSMAPYDFEIRLVLLLHDIGKPKSCQDGEVRHFRGHPMESSRISRDVLKRLCFEGVEIEELCELIKDHDNLITNNDIKNKLEFSRKKFKVQVCDALAYNPTKLDRRINYLLDVNEKLNCEDVKEKYKEFLFKFKKNIEIR